MINTEPINKQDVLIRLLKDGHISDEEFKALYEPEQVITNGFWRPTETYIPENIPPFRHLWQPHTAPTYTTCGTGGSKIGSKELEDYDKPIKPDSIAEYYMTVGKLDEMKAKVKAFENGFGSTIFPSGEAIAKLMKEPLSLKKRESESVSYSPKGFDMKEHLGNLGYKDGIVTFEEHLNLSSGSIPEAMHPKTWAFLNKQSFR